jgi:hypothetical protein
MVAQLAGEVVTDTRKAFKEVVDAEESRPFPFVSGLVSIAHRSAFGVVPADDENGVSHSADHKSVTVKVGKIKFQLSGKFFITDPDLILFAGAFAGVATNGVNINRVNLVFYFVLLLIVLGLDFVLGRVRSFALPTAAVFAFAACLMTVSYFGDYAENVLEYALRLREEEVVFSEEAKGELKELTDKINTLYEYAITAFDDRNVELLGKVEEIEEEVDVLSQKLENCHIDRVKAGACNAQLGSVYLQAVSNLERVGDHITNLALSIRRYRHSHVTQKKEIK